MISTELMNCRFNYLPIVLSDSLTLINFQILINCVLESEKYYHWLLSAPHSAHSHFIPSIQFGIQIMKLLSENKNKRTTWIRILSIILGTYMDSINVFNLP
jgi:hypothetical protein